MKNVILLAILLFFPTDILRAQVTILQEDFDDQNLTSNPAWSGDLQDFTFLTENGNIMLQLDADADPSRTQIVTPATAAAGSWEFYFRQDFNPSNFNRSFIFLMADRQDLNYLDGSSVNGYAIRTGDNQSPRKMRLIRFDNGNQTVLIESETILEEGTGYQVKVTRSEHGEWKLFIGKGYGSEPLEEAEPTTDQTYTSSSWFGILLRYSSGNITHFLFDDFRIQNTAEFKITGAAVTSADVVEATFSYPVDPATLNPQNFHISGLGSPLNVYFDSTGTVVSLQYSGMIANGNYVLSAVDITSRFGDPLTPGSGIDFSFENPFIIVSAEVLSPSIIEIEFNQQLSEPSLSTDNFLINNSVQPVTVLADTSTSVRLQFSQPLNQGPVEIELQNITSTENWKIADGTLISTFLFGEIQPGDIVINEILYRRESAEDPEFVEIFNLSENIINMENWTLETGRGQATLPTQAILDSHDYLVFTDMDHFSQLDDRIIYLTSFQSLRNTGDAVVIKNPDGTTVDSLFYLSEWGTHQPGVSLERKDPAAISIDPANWLSSESETGSTPLEQNSLHEPDISPPVLEFAAYQSSENSIRLQFNEFIKLTPETTVLLNGQPADIEQSDYISGSGLILPEAPFTPGREFVVRVEQISDNQNNISTAFELPVAQPIQPGNLVFNEIMYDPIQDDFDELANQAEYLEAINRQDYAVSLEGIYLHDRPDENGEIRPMLPLSTRSKWIPAQGTALLFAESETTEFTDSKIARFFDLPDDIEPHVLQFDRNTLSLSLTGREIYLADSLHRTIDHVDYRPDWHNPNLIDTQGISLERINPAGDTQDPSNWGSSTIKKGGTPVSENSLFQTFSAVPEQNNISLEPNPFSPDDDGFEDNLLVRYSFDDPNYMLRIRIYDRYGRLVRKLTDSQAAGFDGEMIWDGRTDDGLTNRVGIYILLIEATNSSTGESRTFKETVVLARKF